MEDNIFFIIRSRFQPFTKFHAGLIKEALKQTKKVGLCIIRDYETITLYHRIKRNIGATELRHLPIFNPFTSWEVINHVQSCLQQHEIPPSIPIIVSPLNYPDLVSVSISSRAGGEGFVSPVLKEFIEKPDKCKNGIFANCTAIKDFDSIVSAFTYDMIPNLFNHIWCFPLWDEEDANDYKKVMQCGAKCFDKLESPQAYNLIMGGITIKLGLYGQFLYWIYLRFIAEYHGDANLKDADLNIPDGMKSIRDLGHPLIKTLSSLLKNHVSNNDEFEKYEAKVVERMEKLIKNFSIIPEEERNLLLNFTEFVKYAQQTVVIHEN